MLTAVPTPRVNNNDDVVRLIRVLVKRGDAVVAGEILGEVETDKASFTVEADRTGFVVAVVPQINDMVTVGSVLFWLGDTPDEVAPEVAAAAEGAAVSAAPTVKASQLLMTYGLRAQDVPARGARLSAADVEDYVSSRGLGPVAASLAQTDTTRLEGGTAEALTPDERGMLRTVLWQRQEAVPGYIEVQFDAAEWERAAAEYQQRERLLMNPLLALMAYRLVRVASDNRRLNSTMSADQRFVYGAVNLGVTVQSDTTLYLTVVRNAGQMTSREFVDQLTMLQRKAVAHRLRSPEASGATVSFSSMARWNVTRHVPVLPPHTALIVAHAAPSADGRGTLGATYDHRVLTGFEALSAIAAVSRPEGL